jgi:PDZ domain
MSNIYLMKKFYLLIFSLLFSLVSFSQEGFQFLSKKKKISIPFQLASNLVIIPVKLNHVNLNFLLDTGVEKTILFTIDETDSLQFKHVEKIKVKGLGTGNSIDALQSKYNHLSIKNEFVDLSHEVYIILDQEVNFSTQLGVTVHGIIGFNFFKNNFIEINYQKRKVFVYKNKESFSKRRIKRFDEVSLSLDQDKPYIFNTVILNNKLINTKMLLDTGSSDPMWLFENGDNIKIPQKNFEDFLGRGFSGNIYGKRSRIDQINIGKYQIETPTCSFPDSLSLKSVIMANDRNGSIGSEILKRFDILIDYPNLKIYLKPNIDFTKPFNYNMSGLEIEHNGLVWVKEEVALRTKLVSEATNVTETEFTNLKYKFSLKPVFEISYVRPNSPAEIVGVLKGDKIIRINGREGYSFKLDEITQLMQSEDGKLIILDVERKNARLKFKFKLQKIL